MIIETFYSESDAEAWMVSIVNDLYIDNERFAYFSNPEQMAAYELAKSRGCCGYFDEEIYVNGKRAMIGCNYGH